MDENTQRKAFEDATQKFKVMLPEEHRAEFLDFISDFSDFTREVALNDAAYEQAMSEYFHP